LVCISL